MVLIILAAILATLHIYTNRQLASYIRAVFVILICSYIVFSSSIPLPAVVSFFLLYLSTYITERSDIFRTIAVGLVLTGGIVWTLLPKDDVDNITTDSEYIKEIQRLDTRIDSLSAKSESLTFLILEDMRILDSLDVKMDSSTIRYIESKEFLEQLFK